MRGLKLQSVLAGGVGQRLDSPVVQVAAAVEHDGCDPSLAAPLGDELADGGGRLGAGLPGQGLVLARGGSERPPGHVVDELRRDAAVRAVHGEARPLGRAGHAAAHTPVAPEPGLKTRLAHARFPTLRITCSPW
jgi:hypothetical protein